MLPKYFTVSKGWAFLRYLLNYNTFDIRFVSILFPRRLGNF